MAAEEIIDQSNSGQTSADDAYDRAIARQAEADNGISDDDAERIEDAAEQNSDGDNTADENLDNEQSDADGDSQEQDSDDQNADDDQSPGSDDDDKNQDTDESSIDSELEGVEHWPENLRDSYSKLAPEGRAIVNELHSTLKTAAAAEWHEINTAAEQYADPIALSKQFDDSPVDVIKTLAERAGIELFFEEQLGDEIPEFDDPQQLAQFLDKRNQQREERREADRLKAEKAEREERQRKLDLENGFKEGVNKYPDFGEHKDAILNMFATLPDITPVDAYKLARFDEISNLASQSIELKSQLAEANEQIRQLKAKSTEPSADGGSTELSDSEAIEYEGLSPVEIAHQRALKRQEAA